MQGSLQLAYRHPRATASLQARAASRAFEDDRNALPLPGYAVFDLYAEAPLRAGWTVFGAGENVLDARVVAGRTPVTTLGTPRTWRVGLKVTL